MTDRDRAFALMRLDTGAAPQGPVCGASAKGMLSAVMRHCVLPNHGVGVEHVDQYGVPFGGRLTAMQQVPERRR